MKPRGFYMPELLLKSGWMWLQGAVVSRMIFNPVGRVRQGINLQVDWYADHPATLISIWKMQDECSLLYKESMWKGKKMLWLLRALVKHHWMGVMASKASTGWPSRSWKKLYPECFPFKVKEMTICGKIGVGIETKGRQWQFSIWTTFLHKQKHIYT